MAEKSMTFWEHLDELRGIIVRGLIAVLICSVVVFLLKSQVFGLILGPQHNDFITYRYFDQIGQWFSSDVSDETFNVKLVNTGLAEQFATHVKVSLYLGLMLSLPYLLYQIFQFIAPALYDNEKRLAVRLIGGGTVMFFMGVLVNYFVIFPFTFRFLGTYQVDSSVENMITLVSYIDTLLMMTFLLGLLFELPIVSWLLGKFGILNRRIMRRYRKHTIIAILVVAAIITPTSDAFTLLLTALPICLLYEISIWLVKE